MQNSSSPSDKIEKPLWVWPAGIIASFCALISVGSLGFSLATNSTDPQTYTIVLSFFGAVIFGVIALVGSQLPAKNAE